MVLGVMGEQHAKKRQTSNTRAVGLAQTTPGKRRDNVYDLGVAAATEATEAATEETASDEMEVFHVV